MSVEWVGREKPTQTEKELILSKIRQIVLVAVWDQKCNPEAHSQKFANEATTKVRELLEGEGLL